MRSRGRADEACVSGRVVTVYGSTEAEPISHLEGLTAELRDAIGAGAGIPVGVPVDDVDLRIFADAWVGFRTMGPLIRCTGTEASPTLF